MEKRKFGEYYLGLDIGTTSVGWAVTDLDYKLQRFHGKDMWGVRLFDEGKPAAERRQYRAQRRRTMRRKQRIQLLREMFAKEIAAIDDTFFLRLDESRYLLKDKDSRIGTASILFTGTDYSDRQFYKEYPTVYHLRGALIHCREKFDLRMVYLAVQHILKHRGHFLFSGGNFHVSGSLGAPLAQLVQEWEDVLGLELRPSSLEELERILKDTETGINDKKKEMYQLFSADTKQKEKMLDLLLGASTDLGDAFGDPGLKEGEIKKLSFRDGAMEEKRDQLEQLLGEDRLHLLELMKAVYDWGLLAQILDGKEYLSDAMALRYDRHKEDLALLKAAVRRHERDRYAEVFHCTDEKLHNYCAYIGGDHSKNRKTPLEGKRCKRDDFYKYVKSLLQGHDDDPDVKRILSSMERGEFLPLARSGENSVIPYQLHKAELERILENAEQHYPFLKETDETGWTVSQKIVSLLTFRIPYYVGPLNDAHKSASANCWIVKKSREPVRPWNFDQIVDRQACAEAFITRMTNSCTYLSGADVLPKQSVLYSKFLVLNELNHLKIDEEPISAELKQQIFQDLFLKKRKVTLKQVRTYLEQRGLAKETAKLSGIDLVTDFKATMQSYQDFYRIIGDRVEKRQEETDHIIKWITIFGEEKEILREKISREYGGLFTKAEISEMAKLRYSGWGRLSRELLQDVLAPNEDGEAMSIISAMWHTNHNFMELLGDAYGYAAEIKERNRDSEADTEITYGKVDGLYVSPVVKRQIWQTLTIVKELRSILGRNPKRVFIEVARKQGEKNDRKESRKKRLEGIYKAIEREERDWAKEISQRSEHEFRRDRLYLYYTQMGKCMYTGEAMDIDEIFNENRYDVDHIFPQSRVKDDSLDNRVLVRRTANLEKGDRYPIRADIRRAQRSFWHMLLDKKLISEKKYNRLVRATGFTDDELADFINRQLVETSQSVKAVAQILEECLPKSKVVYVKAKLTSEFRKKHDLPKVRELNHLHHAKDAYLNVVTGNVYYTKFTASPANYLRNEGRSFDYNLTKMYEKNLERGGVRAWTAEGNQSIDTVKRTMDTNRILVTKLAYETGGGLFNVQPMKKGKGQLPLKGDPRMSNIDAYGGYNKVTGAYYCLVEHQKGKKQVRTLVAVPAYLASQIEQNSDILLQYCRETENLHNPVILVSKIKTNAVLNVNGLWVWITGRSGKSLLAAHMQELIVDRETEKSLKNILKYVKRANELKAAAKGKELPVLESDGITKEENLRLYQLFTEKVEIISQKHGLNSEGKALKEGEKEFCGLSVERQCFVLREILKVLSCDRVEANLSEIGGSKTGQGKITVNSNISKMNRVELIDQSPTGLFVKRRDLLKP